MLVESAMFDMGVAYLHSKNRQFPAPTVLSPGLVVRDEVFTCSIFKIEGDLRLEGVIYLDGQGNENSVFIFQIGGSLISAPDSEIVMINGAEALNVFWQVGSTVSLGTYSMFKGTVLSFCRIMADEGVSVEGRLFSDARYMLDMVSGSPQWVDDVNGGSAYPTTVPSSSPSMTYY